ncbi:sensory box/GGDEF family protein [Klebsiella pneumoniae]|uniref:Sensory box/GGDEF family protein n=1 Tax=Klebsiella pneumoniae TaxID=573 RepID=A0A377X9Y6_KLEPN|nr:sensory box/GGDEF family protein [Klebsiella pneumoniae]
MSNDHLTDIAYRHFIESVKDYAIYMLSADGTVIAGMGRPPGKRVPERRDHRSLLRSLL